MLRQAIYYSLKPYIPFRVRLAVRRWFAQRKRVRVSETWPILPGSERPPAGWAGWPHGKQFALVLTHDVERQIGLDQTRGLLRLEKDLGFRSAFNFVPEGAYSVPDELRRELQDNGFEVGIHDHRHDGKLFLSRRRFRASAQRINHYLRAWKARGFRAGFMLHRLDWLHDLEIDYDCSTFDTDPFEPQPDGVNTIFPFFVPRHEKGGKEIAVGSWEIGPDLPSPLSDLPTGTSHLAPASRNRGYVELPYTLVQDSTLFLVLQERTIDIWTRKLDWIARHGGMAMLITHPDYMRFDGEADRPMYPSDLYREFLMYIRSRYPDQYWNALPAQVARFSTQYLRP